MEEVLLRELRGWRIEHSARIGGESRLAAVHFTVYTTAASLRPDRDRLQGQLAAAILTWDEWVLDAAGARDAGRRRPARRRPGGVQGRCRPGRRRWPTCATIRSLAAGAGAAALGRAGSDRCRDESCGSSSSAVVRTLTAVLPVLQQLGVDVLDERPYEIVRPDGLRCWTYDFGLRVWTRRPRPRCADRPHAEVAGSCSPRRSRRRGGARRRPTGSARSCCARG